MSEYKFRASFVISLSGSRWWEYHFMLIMAQPSDYIIYHLPNHYVTSISAKRFVLVWPRIAWFPDRQTGHYSDVIMGPIASQNTSLTIVYSTVYSGADQWKHQISASLAFVRGIHRWPLNYRWPVNSSHKWPVTRKMFPFDDTWYGTCALLVLCDRSIHGGL